MATITLYGRPFVGNNIHIRFVDVLDDSVTRHSDGSIAFRVRKDDGSERRYSYRGDYLIEYPPDSTPQKKVWP